MNLESHADIDKLLVEPITHRPQLSSYSTASLIREGTIEVPHDRRPADSGSPSDSRSPVPSLGRYYDPRRAVRRTRWARIHPLLSKRGALLGDSTQYRDMSRLAAFKLFDADTSISVDYHDYDIFRSPPSDSEEEVADAKLGERVVYLGCSDTYEFTVLEGCQGERGELSSMSARLLIGWPRLLE